MYPPVRQFEQYEFARYLQGLSRPETARQDNPKSTRKRTLLGFSALLVLVVIVASYAVAASVSLHL